MVDIKIVIGANFGDEGKGLMTDYFSQQALKTNKKSIVVLSNGGSQRGHTVDTTNNLHHTFHHFGSGTFANSYTYCSQYFILNAMNFYNEYIELYKLGYAPYTYIDCRCKWSTPFDMLVNQIVEQVRENKKHGSCGIGIWETEVRYTKCPMLLNIYQFNNLPIDKKVEILKSLRDNYFIERLKEYNIPTVPDDWKEIYYSDNLINNFISDIKFMCENSKMCTSQILRYFDTVIFENGQGLLLDQSLTSFYGDNLTPSNTGSINSYNIINEAFTNVPYNIEVCYVSRTYMTRHGVGKFVTECDKSLLNKDMIDYNNITNQFQDNLRYGELNIDSLNNRINSDSQIFKNANISVALTHTNEFMLNDIEKINHISYLSNNKTFESIKTL